MAIVIDVANLGTAHPGGAPTSIAITTGSAVAAGGFIVVSVGFFDAVETVTGISGGSLTWTIDKQTGPRGVARNLVIASAQAPSGLASGTTITATFSAAATAPTMGATSFTGVATSSPIDGTALGPTDASTTGWSTGNYTVAAGSVIIGACWNENTVAGNTTTSPSIEAWEVQHGAGPYSHVLEYRIESGAGSVPVDGTWGAAQPHSNTAVAYKADGGGGLTAAQELPAWLQAQLEPYGVQNT